MDDFLLSVTGTRIQEGLIPPSKVSVDSVSACGIHYMRPLSLRSIGHTEERWVTVSVTCRGTLVNETWTVDPGVTRTLRATCERPARIKTRPVLIIIQCQWTDNDHMIHCSALHYISKYSLIKRSPEFTERYNSLTISIWPGSTILTFHLTRLDRFVSIYQTLTQLCGLDVTSLRHPSYLFSGKYLMEISHLWDGRLTRIISSNPQVEFHSQVKPQQA